MPDETKIEQRPGVWDIPAGCCKVLENHVVDEECKILRDGACVPVRVV